jgi:hypothetical protein
MDAETFEDARAAWRMQFALQTFKSVRAGIEAMLQRGLNIDSPEYYPLIVGLVCLYGRPFKSSKPAGKLDEKIVPEEHRSLHAELIKIRDKAFAHSDSSFALTLGEVSNELRFRRVGRRTGAFATRFLIEPWHFESMLPLLDSLIEKTDYQNKRVCDRVSKKLPSAQGQYTVNIYDPNGPLFKKSEKPVDDIRHSDF